MSADKNSYGEIFRDMVEAAYEIYKDDCRELNVAGLQIDTLRLALDGMKINVDTVTNREPQENRVTIEHEDLPLQAQIVYADKQDALTVKVTLREPISASLHLNKYGANEVYNREGDARHLEELSHILFNATALSRP